MMVRLATAADIPGMLALERDADAAAHWAQEAYARIFAEQELSPCQPQFTDGGRKTQLQRLALVVEDDLGLQGFLVARQIDSEFEIENVVIAASARRQGLGTHLVRELQVFAGCQRAKAVFLEVRESNRAARALYEKCGFTETGRRKRYYQDPEEAAVLYRLDLT